MKYRYATLEDIPENLRQYYTPDTNGTFVLKGMEDPDRVKEFRTNNIELQKKVTQFEKDFGGITPDEIKELRELKTKVDTKKLIDSEGLEAAVSQRVGAMKTTLEKERDDALAGHKTLLSEIGVLTIDNELAKQGARIGILPAAMPDFISRGRGVFRINSETRKAEAFNPDGSPAFSAGNAGPLGFDEWADVSAKNPNFSHMIAPSGGSGAGGSGVRTGAGPEGNPFKRGSAAFNMTEQAKMYKSDPDKARRLAAEAGEKIG